MSRRDIVGDNITAMNPEELKELNALAKANLLNRKQRVRVVCTMHVCMCV